MAGSKTAIPTTLNEKGAASFATTGNARVNFFFKSVRGLANTPDALVALLQASWDEDALDTVKLIFQTRDCRGGKGEKAIFRSAIIWLAEHHPEGLAQNVKHIPHYGTWKDLLSLMGTLFEEKTLDMFQAQLVDDLSTSKAATSDSRPSISLAAKWIPTENSTVDKKLKFTSKMSKRLFPESKVAKKELRKQYLTPLRDYLKITENYMCSGDWSQIEYSKVPSRCMNLHRKAFLKHDEGRFNQFIEDAKSGKVEIKGKQMFPHELVNHYMASGAQDDIIDLQWKVIIDDVKKQGTLRDSLVLSDVSGSMSGTPMQVSIALGLLISEVTEAPFKNAVITFHEKPTFHMVKGGTLKERVEDISRMAWGGTTNFQAVFDLILARAKENKLPPSAMPKRLFVISDMQFDVAGGQNYRTNHQTLQAKFAAAGYQMPDMIYWNVRADTKDFPVASDASGVALVSGFSPSILKDIVEAGRLPDPFTMMKKVIDGERYKLITM